MARVERMREARSELPSGEDLRSRTGQGWRLVALEWEREVEGEEAAAGATEETPFGLKVADDCRQLEEEAKERQALILMLDLIARDHSLSQVAHELNRSGYRTRRGSPWTQTEVFDLLPRLIEVAPGILASEDWRGRRQRAAGSSSGG